MLASDAPDPWARRVPLVEVKVNGVPVVPHTVRNVLAALKSSPAVCLCGVQVHYMETLNEEGVRRRFVGEYVFVPNDAEAELAKPARRRGVSGIHKSDVHKCDRSGNAVHAERETV